MWEGIGCYKDVARTELGSTMQQNRCIPEGMLKACDPARVGLEFLDWRSGGLRCAATSGYNLASLQLAAQGWLAGTFPLIYVPLQAH